MRQTALSLLNKNRDALFLAGRIFSPIYSVLMSVRAGCYRHGMFRTARVNVPVISIGNISMGGTGKTPHVMALCRFLKDRAIKPAVVTRGYGGKAGKGPLVVSDGRSVCTDARTSGDEAFMMASEMPGTVIVAGSDRYGGARRAASLGAEVIVLDDGFQHMALHRDMDVVLLPASSPFDHVFPGGTFREPVSALSRASSIIVTGCEEGHHPILEHIRTKLSRMGISAPVFTSHTRVRGLEPLASKALSWQKDIPTRDKSCPVFAFCGIGTPESFIRSIHNGTESGQNLQVVEHLFFRDHHEYTKDDIHMLFKKARAAGAKALITTSKDAVKISGILNDTGIDGVSGSLSDTPENPAMLPVFVLRTEVVPEQGFWHCVETVLKNNIDFSERK